MPSEQLALWPLPAPEPEPVVNPLDYDLVLLAYSGGKDSVACFLHLLLDLGVPLDRIELHHHLVDGREGSTLMDWPVTTDYCRKFAEAFGVKIFFSWKKFGFEGEMTRNNQQTAPTCFETPDGVVTTGGIQGPLGTRMKFPQVAASLTTRWCSAYLKVDVCSKLITGQERYNGKRLLLVTGERAEESANRACYKSVETHKTSGKKRTVDQWRPVHKWPESDVWAIMQRFGVVPHPSYQLGWGRLSCKSCVFGSKNQWASLNAIAPEAVARITAYEEQFGVTINRDKSVPQMIAAGKPYPNMDPDMVRLALSDVYDADILVSPDRWKLPAGAYGESTGPT